MSNPEHEHYQEDNLGSLRKIIASAATEIQAEFERTDNPWFNCYGSILSRLRYELSNIKDEVDPEVIQRIDKQLDVLFSELRLQTQKYQTRELPPEAIRSAFMRDLEELLSLPSEDSADEE